MASLLPATARAQAVQAVAAPRAAAKAQPAGTAGLSGQAAQRQWVRNALAQRRGIAQRRTPASRSAAARVVAHGGGEALVIGSSGQTAARVIVQLLRAGFKVTAGAQGWAREGFRTAVLIRGAAHLLSVRLASVTSCTLLCLPRCGHRP